MFKTSITIIFLLLVFIFQSVISQESCGKLVQSLYPPEDYAKKIKKVTIKSLSESFLLGELLRFEIERIIYLSDKKVDMTLASLGKRDNEITKYRMEGETFTELDSEGNPIQNLEVPLEIQSVLRQSLEQQWLLPTFSGVVTCNGFQSYIGRLEGREAKINASFEPGKIEEVRVIFDNDKGIVKGFYTPSSQLLVLVDNYEQPRENVSLSYKTSTFYLDGDEPIFVGTESVSLIVEKN